MPRRFVRESKFRHVFGEPYKKASCYDNVNFTKNMWDGGNYCAVNSKFIAVALEGSGGGNFLVLPIEKVKLLLLLFLINYSYLMLVVQQTPTKT